ncbi:HMG domain-containing protein 3 isoform X3 [Choloepus didactylus]|uniref:HMG domain-containing protein 3 isoform X3 n=1 Tax=Choloepus didactylus TaxID=27675 RepID=UPI00189F99E2|nr:HMG domain-containing protein 3 isoform X3 [Choloepus didactylus]
MGPPPGAGWTVALARAVARSHAPPVASGAPQGPPGRVSLAIGGVLLSLLPPLPPRNGVAATPVSSLFSSGSPGFGPRGPWQASVKGLRSKPTLAHPSSKTPYRDSEEEKQQGLSRLRAVCRRAGSRGWGSFSPRDARASSRLHFLVASVTTAVASRRQPGARVFWPAPPSKPLAGCLQECEPRVLHAPLAMDASYDGTEVTVVMEEIEEAYCYTSPGPPKKKKKYKIHGEKAKKPRSAYLLYYYDIYLKVQQELPHLPQSEINKKISESWRLLSVAERSYYLEKAKLEKEGLDPNSKLSALTAVVPDIPGFRKILPRSDYIIIPKSSLQEDRSCPQLELCVAQNQMSPKGGPLGSNPSPETVPSHAGMAEQCLAVEALAEEVGNLAQPGAVHEIATSEILSQDVLLEEASLEVGESHQPYQTSLVIEETLVNGSPDLSTGSLALPHPQIGESLSVVTVMRDSSESSSSAPATQFIMLPLPAYSVVENPTSIKLTTTYTRRGHGTCTSPGCSFTYVTRHKPPKCPTCGNFLGGKWIPKEKPAKVKVELASGVSSKGSVVKRNQQPVTSEQHSLKENASTLTLENLEAVSQLLSIAPPRETGEENEWEEVIISDAHVLVKETPGNRSTVVTKTPVIKSDVQPEVTLGTAENDSPGQDIPPAEGTSTPNPLPASKKPTGVDLLSPGPRAPELRGRARGKPSLLAAARPMRAILPAPASMGRGNSMGLPRARQAFPLSDKTPPVRTCGLKPSTLKQLGQSIQQPSSTGEVKLPNGPVDRMSQVKVVEVKPDMFPLYKYSCTVTLDLGLATSRGRGKCKNPSCSYVYTNRHKPRICPSCGFNLAKDRTEKATKAIETSSPLPDVLSATEPLNAAQREIQRQSTLQLLRKVLQIPENESELAEVFTLIHELNSSRLILSNVSEETVTIEQTSWSHYYESPSTHCLLCSSPLFKGGQNSLAGPQECWLLTASRLQVVTAQVKMCLNPHCLALHSFMDIYTGLFNVGNQLLVSLDLLFAIRNQIKLGEDPRVSVNIVLKSVQEQTEKTLTSEELSQLQELLCSGYWAFECLTVRDYNDMICGICGVAPKVEVAQRSEENVLALKSVEFTWPEFLGSSEVNVEDFWATMETEVIEQVAFPASIPITKFDASVIAPFFPPLMRGAVVVNTEKDKNLDVQPVPGNGSTLVRLLQEGTCKLEQIGSYSEEQLRHLLSQCGIPFGAGDSKDQLCFSLLTLYESVQNGARARQPPPHFTGGKIYKMCPHQVVCGSKYLVRGESARDHVDLLASSRHWPPVYVVDTATPVALCADLCYPELTSQMWGRNQGCFSSPTEPPVSVSCPELLDQHYTVDMTEAEHSVQHPVTKTATRRIVYAGTQPNPGDPSTGHHSLALCPELAPYANILASIADSKPNTVRQRPIAFDNATHYYLYNRLIDFLTSREIVNRQIHDIVQSCQPGEVVIRDTLYRLGVAQIKTETEEEGEEEDVATTAE